MEDLKPIQLSEFRKHLDLGITVVECGEFLDYVIITTSFVDAEIEIPILDIYKVMEENSNDVLEKQFNRTTGEWCWYFLGCDGDEDYKQYAYAAFDTDKEAFIAQYIIKNIFIK